MTRPECEAFRRDFEPGSRGPHIEACPDCSEWAEQVESWRALGTRVALPDRLRARLMAIAERGGCEPLAAAPARTAELLPPALRTRLLRIPAAERARRRVVKARYAVAASYLLAGLFTLATGGASAFVTRAPAARGLAQASARGTELLLGVGGWIVEGCDRANQSMEELFGHLGSRPAGTSAKAAPDTEKENPDGTRKAP